MRKSLFYNLLVISLLSFSACSGGDKSKEENLIQEEVEVAINDFGIPIDQYDVEEATVDRGEFFSTIMDKYGLTPKQVYDITSSSSNIFNVKDLRAGGKYHAYLTREEQPRLAYWVYEIDKQKCVVYNFTDTLAVDIISKEIVTKEEYTEVVINSSLWNDTQNAGASPLLALKLSDIYSWSIDFFGLQKGDSFKAYYETLYCDGQLLDIGDVKYATFSHGGEEYESFYYEQPNDSLGNKYWNEKGESMRKAFLKAPLKYNRISSGFTYHRRHPITRRVQPHTGVDYAAPKGTPVVSIGDGVVLERRYKGAGGNTVKIRHNSVYTTAYLHLSKYGPGIKVGSRVKQGQVIGYVGSTGRSTGPHLDFRVWKNGTPINPLKMDSPPALPIPKDQMSQFEEAKSATLQTVAYYIAADAFYNQVLSPLGISKEEFQSSK